jgi:hypothetical protein
MNMGGEGAARQRGVPEGWASIANVTTMDIVKGAGTGIRVYGYSYSMKEAWWLCADIYIVSVVCACLLLLLAILYAVPYRTVPYRTVVAAIL